MHKVTFTSDFFSLTTSIEMAGSPDSVYSDVAISYQANKFIEGQYGFSPMAFAYDIEVEDVTL